MTETFTKSASLLKMLNTTRRARTSSSFKIQIFNSRTFPPYKGSPDLQKCKPGILDLHMKWQQCHEVSDLTESMFN